MQYAAAQFYKLVAGKSPDLRRKEELRRETRADWRARREEGIAYGLRVDRPNGQRSPTLLAHELEEVPRQPRHAAAPVIWVMLRTTRQ